MEQINSESQEIISFFKRHINLLSDTNLNIRKDAIIQIHLKINEEKLNMTSMLSQHMMITFHKAILKCFSDPIEKIRETAIKIIKELMSRCEDMTPFLPYILSILSERVNCHDLEGILNLPEVMRPPPSQKPQMLIKLIEKSEEIRLELCDLISIIINCCNEECMVKHLDQMCNIQRALAMDPFYEVQKFSCQNISQFCKNFKEILLHFSEILARSILLPLVSKKSKVKIAAIEALGQIFQCGIYKYNANIMEILIGFRDPNSVPIKDFYEPSNKINYFALLITDPKTSVREMFIRSVGDWSINLPDRFDHHPRFVPYLLSGFSDINEEIRETSYEVLEECGALIETEREKDFREQKQFGIDSEWTCEGQLINLPLPPPFKKRPCLGARVFVRTHVRKFFHALYKELKDWKNENREKAANLLLLSIIYTEDFMTQFLYQFIPSCMESLIPKNKDEEKTGHLISKCFELIGRFCDFQAYIPIIKSGLSGEYSENQDFFKASLRGLSNIIKGSLEAVVPNKGIKKKMLLIKEILLILNQPAILNSFAHSNEKDGENVILFNLNNLVFKIIIYIFDTIQNKCNEDEKIEFFSNDCPKLLFNVIFVISYISLVERSFIINKRWNENITNEIIDKFVNFPIFLKLKFINDSSKFKENIIKIFHDYINETSGKEISYSSIEWNSLLIISIIDIFLFQSFELCTKAFEIINKSIKNNIIPEMNDNLIKLILIIYNEIIKSKNTDFTINILAILKELIKWLNNSNLNLNDKFLNDYNFNIIYCLTSFLLRFKSEDLKTIFDNTLNLKSVATILNDLTKLQKNRLKSKKTEILTIINIFFQKVNSSLLINKNELKNEENKYIITNIIDYLFENYNSLELPNSILINKIFETILNIVNIIPVNSDLYYYGEESIIEDYPKFLNNLIKIAIDENDPEVKSYSIKCLSKLCVKTPINFKIEIESADKNKKYSRVELIANIINNLKNNLNN